MYATDPVTGYQDIPESHMTATKKEVVDQAVNDDNDLVINILMDHCRDELIDFLTSDKNSRNTTAHLLHWVFRDWAEHYLKDEISEAFHAHE